MTTVNASVWLSMFYDENESFKAYFNLDLGDIKVKIAFFSKHLLCNMFVSFNLSKCAMTICYCWA